MPNLCPSDDATVPGLRRQPERSHSRDIDLDSDSIPVRAQSPDVYTRLLTVMSILRGFGGTVQECDTFEGRAAIATRLRGSARGTVTFSSEGGVYAVRFEMSVSAPTAEEREAYDRVERNDLALNAYSLTFDGTRAVQVAPVFEAGEAEAILDCLDYIFGPR